MLGASLCADTACRVWVVAAGLGKDVGSRRPVIVAANKLDLLPPSAHAQRLEHWVWRESRALYAHPRNIKGIHLVSSATGLGMPALLESLRAQSLGYAARDGTPAEVVVVGATNAGKSTLMNAISSSLDDADDDGRDRSRGRGVRLTESATPGTTLRCVSMALSPQVRPSL